MCQFADLSRVFLLLSAIHGVPEWGSSRKISNGLDLTVVLSRFKNYRQVLELRSWEFSCVGFAFRRCGKFQNVERDRKNLEFDLVKGLKKTWLRSKTTWHTAKPFDPPVLETPPTLDLHCLIRRGRWWELTRKTSSGIMVTTVTQNQSPIIDQISVFEVKRLFFVVTLMTEVIHLADSVFCGIMGVSCTYCILKSACDHMLKTKDAFDVIL